MHKKNDWRKSMNVDMKKIDFTILMMSQIRIIASLIDIDVLENIIIAGEKHGEEDDHLLEEIKTIYHLVSILKTGGQK